MITWEELETAAPPIAQLAKERFEGTRVALLEPSAPMVRLA